MVEQLSIDTPGAGLHEITSTIAAVVAASNVGDGLCTLFVRHTSASLVIQENAVPSAKRDLERWLNRLVPERDPSRHLARHLPLGAPPPRIASRSHGAHQ